MMDGGVVLCDIYIYFSLIFYVMYVYMCLHAMYIQYTYLILVISHLTFFILLSFVVIPPHKDLHRYVKYL